MKKEGIKAIKIRDWYQHSVQFDNYSDNFLKFERDFYRYSNLDTPLTFITDDLLMSMTDKKKSYFKLPAKFVKDYKDHYFIFQVKEEDKVLNYTYLRHHYSI